MHFEQLHILVAEDHGFQRKALVRMLRGLGAGQVTEAEDGIAALSACRAPERPVDIVIMDLDMPGMDGMELIRHLAEARSTARVIVSSALDKALLASVETMARAYGVPLLGRVDKPVTPSKLSALLGVEVSRGVSRATPAFTADDVRAGLDRREFVAFYQPKASLRDGVVVGVEALARWQHPQYGTLAPASFIGLIEQHGMVEELTWQVLEHAAQAWRQWALQGHILKVSINLSLLALQQPGYAARIIEAVAAHGVDSRYIVFEITESSEMADVPHCLENLTRLRMHGFSLSIDDYGTGYASIQQLLRVPFSELKIDRSFVSAASSDETRLTVLASSLQLAQRLGLEAVAEGVETMQDWDLLASLGCSLAQGYLISRPQPVADLPAAVVRWEESYARLPSAAA
ncbi:EAL domain-containing response regulator [Pseudoduganella sp. RAF53_2]|uniref:EAL domain-containing response regulator n=1 Tax=unclassified Pseudoduganella TaxID=2637179 RepID=UPI003F9DB6DB